MAAEVSVAAEVSGAALSEVAGLGYTTAVITTVAGGAAAAVAGCAPTIEADHHISRAHRAS